MSLGTSIGKLFGKKPADNTAFQEDLDRQRNVHGQALGVPPEAQAEMRRRMENELDNQRAGRAPKDNAQP